MSREAAMSIRLRGAGKEASLARGRHGVSSVRLVSPSKPIEQSGLPSEDVSRKSRQSKRVNETERARDGDGIAKRGSVKLKSERMKGKKEGRRWTTTRRSACEEI